jgi:hypothetical protein
MTTPTTVRISSPTRAGGSTTATDQQLLGGVVGHRGEQHCTVLGTDQLDEDLFEGLSAAQWRGPSVVACD